MNHRCRLAFYSAWFSLLFLGCAADVYRVSQTSSDVLATSASSPALITIGSDLPKLDRIERAVHFPLQKLKQWMGREKETLMAQNTKRLQGAELAQEYLTLHGLTDIHIDVRQHEPAEQWNRMIANKEIHPAWKYTAGTLQHLEYCLLPGRIFHRDRYNAFTKTLSIDSTEPEQALYASATAKYLRSRKNTGRYAAACYLPLVPLHRDYHVANEVLSYARYKGDWELEKELYPQIYGSFGCDLVSQATSIIPAFAYLPFFVKPALRLGGRLGGIATSAWAIKQREQQREQEPGTPTPLFEGPPVGQ